MFWRVVSHMTNTQRQQLLYFATGSFTLPASADTHNRESGELYEHTHMLVHGCDHTAIHTQSDMHSHTHTHTHTHIQSHTHTVTHTHTHTHTHTQLWLSQSTSLVAVTQTLFPWPPLAAKESPFLSIPPITS